MKKLKSYLNGRLENEVDDFIATLENEFGDAITCVHSVKIEYTDFDGNYVEHTFLCPVSDSSVDGMMHDFFVPMTESGFGAK